MIYETRVERLIREAAERGAFDDLPGAGKPLPLRDAGDRDWWVKDLLRRERIAPEAIVSSTIALRREADGFPDSLVDLPTEAAVRAVLGDYNDRVLADRRRPSVGPSYPRPAPRVDVDRLVARWHELRGGTGPPST